MTGKLLSLVGALATLAAAGSPIAGVNINVDSKTKYQVYDGTGVAEAFQRSLVLHELNAATQKQALDLLFTNKGAGLTILRNGIGSSPTDPFDHMKSIAPNAPRSNSTNLNFIALPREDEYQVWLSKQVISRGVHTIYADAWSADGYMKTNNTDTYGGYICGVSNTSCATGDWRQAYANKLVKYIQDYEAQSIKIDYLGFLNEPDLSTPYASMQSSGQQAADFLKILKPTLQKAGIKTQIACCDGSGWEQNRDVLTGIQAAGEEDTLGLVTAHGYSSRPGAPFQTSKKVWQTEWSTFDDINYDWYNSSTGSFTQSFGLTWANNIQSAFANSNVTGFLYWWGAANATDNESLIFVNGTNEIKTTKRLYAMAHFGSQFIRQGANRISVNNAGTVNSTAFANTDGSIAVQLINNGDAAQSVTVAGLSGSLTTYLTNQQNDILKGTAPAGQPVSVPARSLLSLVQAAPAGYGYGYSKA